MCRENHTPKGDGAGSAGLRLWVGRAWVKEAEGYVPSCPRSCWEFPMLRSLDLTVKAVAIVEGLGVRHFVF